MVLKLLQDAKQSIKLRRFRKLRCIRDSQEKTILNSSKTSITKSTKKKEAGGSSAYVIE
jgi:hypothetical protein